MRINRFPKMAALQKFRALRLGYPEQEAEAIGIAEAVKYAIFKRLAHSLHRYREAETRKKKPEVQLDWDRYALFQLAALDGKPFVGGKVYTDADYKRAIFLRWGDEIGKQIEQWAQQIIEQTPEEWLRDERQFFNKVWVPHRDEPIVEEQ